MTITSEAKLQCYCKCGKGWNGYNTCHCTTCHETFTGIAGFDKHRLAGKCLDPATMVWGTKSKRAGQLVFRDAGRAYQCWASAESDASRWATEDE